MRSLRTIMMFMFTLGMISAAFAGLRSEHDRENQWFRNCEDEIARPFCGTLKIDLDVEALASQWQKPPTVEKKAAKSPVKEAPTTSYLAPHDTPEALQR